MKNETSITKNINDCKIDIHNLRWNKTVDIKQDGNMICLTHNQAIQLAELIIFNIEK